MGERVDEQQLLNWIADIKSDDPVRVAKGQSEYSTLKYSYGVDNVIINAEAQILGKIVAVFADYPFHGTQAALLHRCGQPNFDQSLRDDIVTLLRLQFPKRQWEASLILHLLWDVGQLQTSGTYRSYVGSLVKDLLVHPDPQLFEFLKFILDKSPSETGEAVVATLANLNNHERVVPLLLERLRQQYGLHIGWASSTGFVHPRAYVRGLIKIASDEAVEGLITALSESSKLGKIDHIIAEEMEHSSVPYLTEAVENYWRSMKKY
jgi:hypothetical protein